MPNVIIIGAGGVGSWLTPAMCMLVGPHQVTVVDGDKLEQKNLNRQLFTEADLGRNKAEALGERYNCAYDARWFAYESMEHSSYDLLMVCADNNAARLAAIRTADTHNCRVIVAANETYSAEAYYYRAAWQDTAMDPRIYYPELLTDHTANPLAQNSGCTGEAQEEKPQLVSANFMAASLAQQLYVLWVMRIGQIDAETRQKLPFKLNSNLSRLEFKRVSDAIKEKEIKDASSSTTDTAQPSATL